MRCTELEGYVINMYGKQTAQEMAEAMKVSTRQVYRAVQNLKRKGEPSVIMRTPLISSRWGTTSQKTPKRDMSVWSSEERQLLPEWFITKDIFELQVLFSRPINDILDYVKDLMLVDPMAFRRHYIDCDPSNTDEANVYVCRDIEQHFAIHVGLMKMMRVIVNKDNLLVFEDGRYKPVAVKDIAIEIVQRGIDSV